MLNAFKGQFISNVLFSILNSQILKNEQKQFNLRYHRMIVVKSNFFVCFFGRIEDTKKTFRN